MANRSKENPVKKLGDLSPLKAVTEAARNMIPFKANARASEIRQVTKEMNKRGK